MVAQNNTNWLLYSLEFYWVKSRVGRTEFLSGSSRGDSVFLPFQFINVSCISWLLVPFHPQSQQWPTEPFSCFIILSLILFPPSATLKGPLWFPWTHPNNPGKSCCFKTNRLAMLAPSAILISPWHLMQHIHRFQELGHRCLGAGDRTSFSTPPHSGLQGPYYVALVTSLTSYFPMYWFHWSCCYKQMSDILPVFPWWFDPSKDLHRYLCYLLHPFAQKSPSQWSILTTHSI